MPSFELYQHASSNVFLCDIKTVEGLKIFIVNIWWIPQTDINTNMFDNDKTNWKINV